MSATLNPTNVGFFKPVQYAFSSIYKTFKGEGLLTMLAFWSLRLKFKPTAEPSVK